ncbi:MAG: ribonuclease III domain-containing protein [Eubacteriales bacterium]|nr:ribonuclease III domain-containing protein [Eubacteriales bacterium]
MIHLDFKGDWRELPVSTLAYLGDAVFELYVRLTLCQTIGGHSGDLHRKTVKLVKASAQAEAAHRILPLLNEAEEAVFRRGRNNQPSSHSKSADPVDYRVATGLETLIGYLYLNKEEERLMSLMAMIVEGNSYGSTEKT